MNHSSFRQTRAIIAIIAIIGGILSAGVAGCKHDARSSDYVYDARRTERVEPARMSETEGLFAYRELEREPHGGHLLTPGLPARAVSRADWRGHIQASVVGQRVCRGDAGARAQLLSTIASAAAAGLDPDQLDAGYGEAASSGCDLPSYCTWIRAQSEANVPDPAEAFFFTKQQRCDREPVVPKQAMRRVDELVAEPDVASRGALGVRGVLHR